MQQTLRQGLAPTILLSLVSSLVAQDGAPAVAVTTDANGAAYDLTIVHLNQPGHPTNVVPGLGIAFRAGGGSTSAFERPILSSDGQHLGLNVIAATGTTSDDDVLIVDGALIMQEGSPTPWPTGGENVGTIDADFALDNAGDILLGNNTSSTTNDDYIALFQNNTWTVLAQEGGAVNSVLPSIVGGTAGTWDDAMDAPVLLDDGTALWRATGIDGLTTGLANDAVIVLGNGLAVQEGVDIPLNQANGAMETWQTFDFNDLYASPDGSIVVIQGDLNGSTATDDIVTLNGIVIVQEGSVLAGSSFAEPVDASGIVKAWVDRAGNYYVRGNNDLTETDWVYRNGIVVAESSGSDEIVPGSGEHWDDADYAACFFAFDGNNSGAYLIGGVTDGPSDQNGVLVLDDGSGSRHVVCRESDPIDTDGNGLFDDDRFFNTFGNDDVRLLDDGTILVVATVKDGTGTAIEQGLFELSPVSASCTLRNGSGVNPLACDCATLPVLGTSWDVTVAPLAVTVATFAFAADLPLPVPVPLFGGEALVAPPVVEIPATGIGTHSAALPLDLQFLGVEFYVQGVRLNLVGPSLALELVNGQDAVVGL